MIAMLGGFVTNIILDFLLVWVYGQGMTGAALATIIGQGVTFVIALLYFVLKRKLHICIDAGEFGSLCKSIFKVGLAPFGLALTPNISLVIINRFSAYYGGEKKRADLAEVKRMAYIFAVMLAFVGCVIMYLGRGHIGTLFGSSDAVNAEIAKIMPIFLVSVPFVAITRISTAGFYATEKAVLSYVLTFIEPALMLVLMLILPPLLGGQIMIWWSTVFARILSAVLALLLAKSYKHKNY